MRSNQVVNINKIIHERARLLILTYLASSEKTAVSFNELQKELDFTSGNLSIQLKKLKTAEYLVIKKTFRNNKPYTSVSITHLGSEALYRYVEEMETLILSLKR
jgi:DNA-binding HxlR family transcriptional regulator